MLIRSSLTQVHARGLHRKDNICRVCHASAAKHVASDPQRSRTLLESPRSWHYGYALSQLTGIGWRSADSSGLRPGSLKPPGPNQNTGRPPTPMTCELAERIAVVP